MGAHSDGKVVIFVAMKMRFYRFAGLVAAALASALGGATTYPMTMHAVQDPKGVHGVAFRYLAPKGWKTNAVLNWSENAMNATQLMLSAVSVDGRFTFMVNSGIDFPFYGGGETRTTFGTTPGYQGGRQPPRVLSDFLVEYVKGKLSKADIQVTKREDKPLTGAALPYKRNFGMASSIEFAFTDDKGQACTGAVAAWCHGNVASNTGGLRDSWTGDWMVENLVLIGGPKGEEKKTMRFFSLSAPTITATRQFAAIRYAYVDMLNKQMNADMKAQFERGQMQFKATQEQYAKGNAAWRAQEAAQDKSMQGFKDYLGGVERYRGANGEEIKVAQTPGGAWQGPNGSVLLSDDPHYDPNGLRPEAGGWHRLQKAP